MISWGTSWQSLSLGAPSPCAPLPIVVESPLVKMASLESDVHPDGLPWLVLGHNRLGLGHSGLAPVALGHSGLALMVLGHSGQASLASEQYLVVCGGLAQQSDLKNKVRLVQLHFHDIIVCTPVTTSVHVQIEHCPQECRWYPWHAGGIHSM